MIKPTDIDLDATLAIDDGIQTVDSTCEVTAATGIYRSDHRGERQTSADYDATRIAVVDPKTGTELTKEADINLERTVVQPLSDQTQTPNMNANAAYVPQSSHRRPDDATAIWNASTNRIQFIGQWIRPHRTRYIVLLIVLCIAIVVPGFCLQANTQSDSKQIQTRVKNDFRRTAVPRLANTKKVVKKCTLYEAVALLTSGEYEAARAAYRFLHKKHPENQSFALTLSILETQEKYQ